METTENKIIETNSDFEVRSLDTMCVNESALQHPWWYNFKYLAAGVFFGIILVKAQIVSWFRIQEMFHLQSFHMYGIIGSAVVVGAISVALIKKFKIKTIAGEDIHFYPRTFNKGQIFGGLIFGLGWAITGACPGPLYAQIAAGFPVVIVTLLSAVAGYLGVWIFPGKAASLIQIFLPSP